MTSRKRKTIEVEEESVESPILYDIAALRIFLYENDLYRNGRYTSNKAFKDKLGEHGSEFDFVMRNTFQSFVRKLLLAQRPSRNFAIYVRIPCVFQCYKRCLWENIFGGDMEYSKD